MARVEVVGLVKGRVGVSRHGSGLGESVSGARLKDAPKRVESRRRWEGGGGGKAAPDSAPCHAESARG